MIFNNNAELDTDAIFSIAFVFATLFVIVLVAVISVVAYIMYI